MKRAAVMRIAAIAAYFVFIGVSWLLGYAPGQQISANFADFSLTMLKILPAAFILIGLFEVWVKRETVEKYLGTESGIRGYLWAVLLSSSTVGGLYVAFPVAYALYGKGARLGVIFAYLGASAICRVPMGIFEASFLGIKFTAIRLLVSLPLVVLSAMLLEKYFLKRNYQMPAGK